MLYNIAHLQLEKLLVPASRAGEALARLDERILRSPLRLGFIERQDFGDAISSMWVDGELVHMEDLVLHEARMDVRAPTHEMISAYRILRTRRTIFANVRGWAFSASGLSRLRGKISDTDESTGLQSFSPATPDVDETSVEDAPLQDAFSELDALLARSTATLQAVTGGRDLPPSLPANDSHALIRDADWDEEERLEEWRQVHDASQTLPPILRAAIMLDAWNKLEVLQRSPWLGRLLTAAFLRDSGVSPDNLPALSPGLRAVARDRRHAADQTERTVALLDSFYEAAVGGLKEHDRLLHARERMLRKLVGRRSSSRLPALIDLVVARPVVSASVIVKELGTTPQGAVGLANQLELREVTGRGRFRAWGML
ncbi:RHE_PE00001 family protein [Rhizobium sp. RM]|uniref:RHE_PE00001 family protein n=1 Tax=Rhizobium sp. RM TaxID=2748079 RepID=UPI00110D8B39|nr:RHE_PE00001 family protein [Rhizobium sp. RM]NWJ24266.1 DUF1612 and helix-turn-helix domain-containing protein [Rhizobium sp. RM]TMV21178.1 DUF1612 domain-containing protein [Rhizobium sp. Td3]